MTNEFSSKAVVGFDGTCWHPTAAASGPFGGLHGGVVSALLVGDLERKAEAGQNPMSAKVYMIRPAPLAPLTTVTSVVRQGARLGVVENELFANDKLQAKASVCFMKDISTPGLAKARPEPDQRREAEIADLPEWGFKKDRTMMPDLLANFLDAVDMHQQDDMIWARLATNLLEGGSDTPLSRTICIADFSTIFTVVLDGKRPPLAGWPNANIDVHLGRTPVGDWIGVRPRSFWYDNGTGMTEAELHDSVGQFGRSLQTVALLPQE